MCRPALKAVCAKTHVMFEIASSRIRLFERSPNIKHSDRSVVFQVLSSLQPKTRMGIAISRSRSTNMEDPCLPPTARQGCRREGTVCQNIPACSVGRTPHQGQVQGGSQGASSSQTRWGGLPSRVGRANTNLVSGTCFGDHCEKISRRTMRGASTNGHGEYYF